MTKASDFHGLALPMDASPHITVNGVHLTDNWDTHLLAVTEVKDLYVQAMERQGWIYISAQSTSDPRQLGGFTYSELFCRPGTNPAVVASVIVGAIDGNAPDAATGKNTEIIFGDLSPEGTCP